MVSDTIFGNTRYSEGGTVPTFQGLDDSVEILFIDGAKSWRGMAHLIGALSKNLMPGMSLLVCQDYKFWGAYWVPIMMHRLRGHVEVVHNVLGVVP